MRALPAAVLTLLALAAPAAAQVDCSNPDNLCTGDPCVIPALELGPSCVVDFGPRQVVIDGTLRVTDVLDLTALGFTVQGRIVRGDLVRLTGSGGIFVTAPVSARALIEVESVSLVSIAARLLAHDIRLRSSGAGVLVTKPLRARPEGGFKPEIEVEAALEIEVRAPLTAIATGSVGGEVVLDAGGLLTLTRSVNVDSRGFFAGGGDVLLRGDAGVVVGPGASFFARHRGLGGLVFVESATGDVDFRARVLVGSREGPGGELNIRGQNVTVAALMNGDGGMGGGEVDVEATGDLTLGNLFQVRTDPADSGGRIRGVAGGNLTAVGRFEAAPGGDVCLSAGGVLDTSGATFDGPVDPCL